MSCMDAILDEVFREVTMTAFDRDVVKCANAGMSKAETARQLETHAMRITNWAKNNPSVVFMSGNRGRVANNHRRSRNRFIRLVLGFSHVELVDYRTLRKDGGYSPDEAAVIIKSQRKKDRLSGMGR